MLSPAPSASPPRGALAERPHAWADCPRCGEHWPGGSPYCVNCGWTPDGPGATTGPAAPAGAGRRLALPLVATGLAMAVSLLLWAWPDDRDAASPQAPGPGTATGSIVAQAPTPAPAPASAPAGRSAPAIDPASAAAVAEGVSRPMTQAPAAEPPAASSPAPAAPPARADPGPDAARLADQFVRHWLAAEAGAAGDPSALRDYYADQVAYRGRAAADWAVIAADKARFMQRWPSRRYELLALQPLNDGTEGRWQAALHVRWQLQNQGRWRRGESVTLLTLRWIDGRWRIVAEAAGGARPGPATPAALPA